MKSSLQIAQQRLCQISGPAEPHGTISAPEPQALGLTMNHGSVPSSYCVQSAMFQQQLCTPKAFQPAEGEPLAMRRNQQPLPYATKGSHHHMDLEKLTAKVKPVVQHPSELAFLLPIHSCKTQPHECSKEVKPKGQTRAAHADHF